MRCLSFVILLLLSSSALADDAEKLLGNWKLVSFLPKTFKQNSAIIRMASTRMGTLDLLQAASSHLFRQRTVRRRKRLKNRLPPIAPSLLTRESGGWKATNSSQKWTLLGTPDG